MTEGMSLFLSHELPAVVFYSEKEGFKLARNKQETYKMEYGGSQIMEKLMNILMEIDSSIAWDKEEKIDR